MTRLLGSVGWCAIIAVAALGIMTPTSSATQRPTTGLDRGSRVRATMSDTEPRRRSGTFLALRSDTLILAIGSDTAPYPLPNITRLEVRRTNYRGAFMGGVLGAGVGLAIGVVIPQAIDVPDEDKLGYAMLSTASGMLIGAALGTGKRARIAGGIGFLVGTAVGAFTFGQACEHDSPTICPLVLGAAFGGSSGLFVGSGIGALLPNWVPVRLDELQLSLSAAPRRVAATVTVKLPAI